MFQYRDQIRELYDQALARHLIVHDWQSEQNPEAILELNESSV